MFFSRVARGGGGPEWGPLIRVARGPAAGRGHRSQNKPSLCVVPFLRYDPYRSVSVPFFLIFFMKCLLFVRFVWLGDHAGLGLSRFRLSPFDRLVAAFSG